MTICKTSFCSVKENTKRNLKMDEEKINHIQSQEPSIKLTRNTKGYAWEIKYSEKSFSKVIEEIEKANKILIEKFGGKKE